MNCFEVGGKSKTLTSLHIPFYISWSFSTQPTYQYCLELLSKTFLRIYFEYFHFTFDITDPFIILNSLTFFMLSEFTLICPFRHRSIHNNNVLVASFIDNFGKLLSKTITMAEGINNLNFYLLPETSLFIFTLFSIT